MSPESGTKSADTLVPISGTGLQWERNPDDTNPCKQPGDLIRQEKKLLEPKWNQFRPLKLRVKKLWCQDQHARCSLNHGVNVGGVKAKPFVEHMAILSTWRKGKITHRRDLDRCPPMPPSHFPFIVMLFSFPPPAPPHPPLLSAIWSLSPLFGPNSILTNPASHLLLPNPIVSLHPCSGLNYVLVKDIKKSSAPVPQNET